MPRKAIDYSKTIIYKLCCNDPDVTEIYIGNTTDFTKRKNGHKSRCNNENSKKYLFKVYQYIRSNGGWNNWSMILIEKYPCLDALEAKQKEQDYILKLHSTLNSQIPNRTKPQWNNENKEHLQELSQKYREINKDKYKEQKRIYYLDNINYFKEKMVCECGSTCKAVSKNRHFKTLKHQKYLELVN